MLVRPVTMNDHAALLSLARDAGYGMTSLPQDADVLEAKIIWSEESFAGIAKRERELGFLFVMEDPDTGEIVGSTGIKSHVGLSSPFYSYKSSTLVQANSALEIYTLNRVLHMVNDYTGASEIGSLFLRESYRRDGLGKFLSRCRFLMLAEHPKLFDDTVMAEMRGVHDEDGNSPFYDHLARHFFKMSFHEADYIHATRGGQFIADLMPKYPIYVELLAPEAQAVLGVANAASLPAQKMLEREGFASVGYVDIFDAGPTLHASVDRIATVRQSRRRKVAAIVSEITGEPYMIANGRMPDFRMTLTQIAKPDDGGVVLSAKAAELLQVEVGDRVRVARAV